MPRTEAVQILDGANAPWQRLKAVRRRLGELELMLSGPCRRNERGVEPELDELFVQLKAEVSYHDELLMMAEARHDEPVEGVHRSIGTLEDAVRYRANIDGDMAEIGQCGRDGLRCYVCRECRDPNLFPANRL